MSPISMFRLQSLTTDALSSIKYVSMEHSLKLAVANGKV